MTAPAVDAAGPALVIGGGLAGAAVAHALASRGRTVRVFDAADRPASGASALPAGLMAPHLSGDDNLLSRLSRHGVQATWQHAQALLRDGVDWQGIGALEHRVKSRRAAAPIEDLPAGWHREASEGQRAAARLPADAVAVWHPRAAWIRPAALVRAWLGHPGVAWCGGTHIARIAPTQGGWCLLDEQGRELARAPLVVIAAALGSDKLSDGRLAVQPVRGQVSWGLQSPMHRLPEFPVNGNGHLLAHIPTQAGLAWISGSTYGRGDTGLDERPADHAENLARLRTLVPAIAESLAPEFVSGRIRGWTGVRCASTDRRPLVGELGPGLWACTAMGSRGLTFAALCAQLLVARLHGEPLPLPESLAAALDLARQARAPS